MDHLGTEITRGAALACPVVLKFTHCGKRSLFSVDQMQTGHVRMRAGMGSSQMSPRRLEGRDDPTQT